MRGEHDKRDKGRKTIVRQTTRFNLTTGKPAGKNQLIVDADIPPNFTPQELDDTMKTKPGFPVRRRGRNSPVDTSEEWWQD